MKKKTHQNEIVNFCEKHGVTILVSIGCAALVTFGIKKHLDNGQLERWLKNASLPELIDTRNIIQNEYLNCLNDLENRRKIKDYILPVIDKYISKIEWGEEMPCGPKCHPTHGCLLYKAS